MKLLPASLALALLGPACGPPRPKVVLLVVVDTLRADALGCYGDTRVGEHGARPSPNLDALAADGVLFERAHAVAPWTIPSLVSSMSGLWPWEHGQLRLLRPCPPAQLELVPLLRARGFRTAGVMTNFIATGRYGFDAGFDRWDDSFAAGHEGSTGHDAVRRLLAMADEMQSEGGERLFLLAWLFEPHYRYEAHEGVRFGPGFGDEADAPYGGPLTGDEELPDLQDRRATLTADDARFLRGRYQSEVAWVDDAIGELLDGLRSRGLYDDTLVVAVSDHGEEVLDRGWIGHTVTLHEELVRVPWIVRLPRGDSDLRRGTRVAAPVSLIDLPATLLDLATGEEPDRSRGELGHSRSLAWTVRDDAEPVRRWLYLHTDFEPVLDRGREEARALQWGVLDARTSRKWIVDRLVPPGGPAGEQPRVSLYDLATDPGETRDLAADPDERRTAVEMQRFPALAPEPLDERPGTPVLLSEEPWIRGPGSAGPP